MIVSIHQPAYLPWLGYFDKIMKSDVFVYLDTVQFQKNSFQNRNKIRTSNSTVWLTVPVITKNILYTTPLHKLPIDNKQNWRKKHLNTIRMNYSKAPYSDRVFPFLEECYSREWVSLSDICFYMLTHFLEQLEIKNKVIKASDLRPFESQKSALLLDICKEFNATTYLSGSVGRNYLDTEIFSKNNVDIVFQDYQHPVYYQVYKGFEPNMPIIDLIMNEENPRDII